MLVVLAAASISYAGDFGVKVQIDLPLDPAGATAFISNPIGYATNNLDAITLSAFAESGPWGVRFDLESATEVRFGAYRILNSWDFIVIGHQSTLGVYTGYNWNGEGFYLRLRGDLLLYGTF